MIKVLKLRCKYVNPLHSYYLKTDLVVVIKITTQKRKLL